MSKREPLLSDHEVDLLDIAGAVRTVRDFYERLIDEGRLIVAKEVEMLNGYGFSIGTCSGCGILALKQHKHCPGCGGKIKR